VTRVPPPVLALATVLVQRRLTGPKRPPGAARRAAVVALTAASVAIAGTASTQFRRRGTTVDPIHPEKAAILVTSGPNALTRNPMYVGMAGLVTAHTLWWGKWAAVVPAAAYVALIDRTQIAAEEVALSAKFGADYDAYRATAPRWLDQRSLSALRS
jgi:protein-S-isoprenylcysteine O-methyltransferase Ste14